MSDELAQCEQCGVVGPEESMTLVEVPGATLAFCEDCYSKPREKEVL